MSDAASSRAPARPPAAWIVVAHIVGAAAIGALECARLGSPSIALAVIPAFAATGLIAGATIAGVDRLVAGRSRWLAAIALAAPALIVFVPVARSLFQGAYAQTLPLAGVAPYALPAALWFGTAGAIALGGRVLRNTDLTTRGILVLVVACSVVAIVWVERHVLKTGYPTAHAGATLAIIVLAGIAVRITRRSGIHPIAAALIAAVVIGSAATSAVGGLRSVEARRTLAVYGDQSRDLVGIWRSLLDFDRDGSSVVLGGGDCDDLDDARHPGAVDTPGDGIDQDCDGSDAQPVVVNRDHATPPPGKIDLATWRASPEVAGVLGRTKGMHVLLITVDALRADLLAPGAPHREDFPTLTKLLDESVWFTRGIAPASGTDVSLTTMLTGRFDPFQAIASTFPEALQAHHVHTFAAIPAEVLRYAGEVMIGRGVDKLVTVHTDWDHADVGDHVSAPATTSEGLKAIAEIGESPAFIWLHYFDVHEHHQIKVPPRLLKAVDPGGSDKAHGYRGLLRAIDDEVAKLRQALVDKGLADKTIIVFASDHGESLGEDRRLLETHGKVTYSALVRIPIAFHIPGVPAGQRTDLISLVDLAPTVLDLLGATPEGLQLDGENLVPAILDAPIWLRPQGRAVAVHEELQWAVVEWPHQLIVHPADNLVELYDLDKDPKQATDLSAKLPDVVARLKTRYAEFPAVRVDRTPSGRSWREQQARLRPRHGL